MEKKWGVKNDNPERAFDYLKKNYKKSSPGSPEYSFFKGMNEFKRLKPEKSRRRLFPGSINLNFKILYRFKYAFMTMLIIIPAVFFAIQYSRDYYINRQYSKLLLKELLTEYYSETLVLSYEEDTGEIDAILDDFLLFDTSDFQDNIVF